VFNPGRGRQSLQSVGRIRAVCSKRRPHLHSGRPHFQEQRTAAAHNWFGTCAVTPWLSACCLTWEWCHPVACRCLWAVSRPEWQRACLCTLRVGFWCLPSPGVRCWLTRAIHPCKTASNRRKLRILTRSCWRLGLNNSTPCSLVCVVARVVLPLPRRIFILLLLSGCVGVRAQSCCPLCCPTMRRGVCCLSTGLCAVKWRRPWRA
jgi:hypothetical protein